MKASNFGHLMVQLHSFEIQRKSRIDFWSQLHLKGLCNFIAELLSAEGARAEPHTLQNLVTH